MRRISTTVCLLLAVALLFGWRQLHPDAAPTVEVAGSAAPATAPTPPARAERTPRPAPPSLPAFLPPEAQAVVARILRDGPYPYPQDGSTFGNYEGHLPRQPRGWYHEYTVPTPGLSHRGTRRIVTGGTPPQVWYYSADHYRSFRRFELEGTRP